MNYAIKHENGITLIKLFEKINYEEGKQLLDEIAANYPYQRRLWDMSEITFDYTMDEIIKIAQYSKKIFTKPNKLAVYTLSDLTYGVIRELEVYREVEGKVESRPFRNKQEAIDWLNIC